MVGAFYSNSVPFEKFLARKRSIEKHFAGAICLNTVPAFIASSSIVSDVDRIPQQILGIEERSPILVLSDFELDCPTA